MLKQISCYGILNENISLQYALLFYFIIHRLNRKATYNLEKDLKDKFAALSIDKNNAELRNNSAAIHRNAGAAKIDAK